MVFLHGFFTCISGQPTLNKLVTMAMRKGLFMICKIKNFSNPHLGELTEFQGYNLTPIGVLRHFLAMGGNNPQCL